MCPMYHEMLFVDMDFLERWQWDDNLSFLVDCTMYLLPVCYYDIVNIIINIILIYSIIEALHSR